MIKESNWARVLFLLGRGCRLSYSCAKWSSDGPWASQHVVWTVDEWVCGPFPALEEAGFQMADGPVSGQQHLSPVSSGLLVEEVASVNDSM